VSLVRQQVNLYQPSADARTGESVPFAAATAGLFAITLCAGLFGVWGFGVWRVGHLERALAALRTTQQHQNETMATLGAARAAGVSHEQLDATISALTAALDIHARALQLLRGGGAGQVTGFSARLSALARRPLEGVWLDHVVLSGLDGAMSVGGSTLDPDLVPRYLHGLADEAALAGVRFDDFVIEQPTNGSTGAAPPPTSPPNRHFNFRAESASVRTGTGPGAARS
jgi:hypothetical protein